MRAVVYSSFGRTPQLREIPAPAAPPGGVTVRVSATGVCRSDHHAWTGADPVRLPHVPGHELVGTVEEVGAGVNRWSGGERVTVPFVCGCGRCEWCAAGDAQVCPDQRQPGFTDHGSFAEVVALHAADTNLVAVPESLDDVAAAALGCRFATAYRALTAHGGLRAGDRLAVHGMGGVGLSALLIARELGARVVAVDVSPAALTLATNLGAEDVIDASGCSAEEVAARVHEATGGGVHVSLDAVGHPQVARQSVLSLRRRGRHVQAGLLLGDHAGAALAMDRVVAWELSIHGTHGLAARDYPAMLDLASRVDLAALVGRVVGLEDAGAALATMDSAATTAGVTVVDLRRETPAPARPHPA
ncbi:zinc-dependent alcohol dehydrogenase family protein [Mobilicoccus caccae]|uniref:Alcohol dehydrogenase n=1 Tax=Mobilicoccus caccae TaxID=1859295 RepID=A0ABQ6ISH0_9MICO|nr:zinc-dependent alcohol dehydrogenase family protein [Mobilicoccus caccae]GMA40097.1 alcohol dehydrogenase [Mobilicoccus caccae]